MNAAALPQPAWLAQVPRDAISVALVVHGDFRAAHAAKLAWDRALELDVCVSEYAEALTRELAKVGLDIEVPVLEVEPSGISERYTLRYRVERMAPGGAMIVHGLEISWRRSRALKYKIACGSQYVTGVALDDVEQVAWRLLVKAGRAGEDPTAGLRARMDQVKAAIAAR